MWFSKKKIDWYLILPTLFLLFWSVIHLYTICIDTSYYYFQRQLIWVGIGIFLLFFFYLLPNTIWFKLSYIAYVVIVFLLVIVLIKGEVTYGAKRWLEIGFTRFQPSEFAKLVLILSLARILSDRKEIGWKIIGVSFLLTLLLSFLIAFQPDLGTALIFLFLWLVFLFVSGISLRKFLILLGILIASFPLSYVFLLPYQKMRILAFLKPQTDPLGAGWSSLQSKIALGSGGLLGRGIGGAAHTQLRYLPQPYTDFIFSSIGEEWGFIGVLIIMIAYIVIVIRGISLALREGNSFSGLFTAGFTILIVIQAFINMGMASGIIPVTGVPLPFLSYGGSSIFLFLSGMGIVLSFSKEG